MALSTTPDSTAPYKVLMHREETWYEPKLDTVVEGWEFRVEWLATGAVFTVQVPGTPPSTEQVDEAIRDAGESVAGFGNLGA